MRASMGKVLHHSLKIQASQVLLLLVVQALCISVRRSFHFGNPAPPSFFLGWTGLAHLFPTSSTSTSLVPSRSSTSPPHLTSPPSKPSTLPLSLSSLISPLVPLTSLFPSSTLKPSHPLENSHLLFYSPPLTPLLPTPASPRASHFFHKEACPRLLPTLSSERSRPSTPP